MAVLIACTRVYLFVPAGRTSTVTYGLIKFTYGLRLMRINLLTGFVHLLRCESWKRRF